MAQTFNIRFARSAGLAGFFEEPANRFRWKGAGRLSIDAQGVRIAVKRGLLTLFSKRSRHIAARDLTDVYREGDALRLEFDSDDKREVLPIWATGSDSAAQIVKLLPTTRTVELESTTLSAPAYRFDWSVLAWFLAVGVVLALGFWALYRASSPPVASAPAKVLAGDVQLPSAVGALPAATAPPAAVAAATVPPAAPAAELPWQVHPLERNSPSYPAARLHISIFEAELTQRFAEYAAWLESPAPVDLGPLERRWEQMAERILRSTDYQGPELWMLRDVQLGVCRNWQKFLLMYAAGLRAHDSNLTTLAFMLRRDADTGIDWLRWYVPR